MSASLMLRSLAAICAILGVFPLANVMTHGSAIPWWPLAVREWLLRGSIVLALAALLTAALGARIDVAAARARRELLSIPPRAFALGLSLLAFGAAVFYARFCFSGQPFTTDEMAQQWHARILLGGHLSAVAEPMREFFNTAPVLDGDGRWFSQYPVGGPAFIAMGMLFKAAWLVNPVLLAFTTWNLYRFFALAFDELIARVTTLLFVISPMVLIMAASQMNHAPALAFTTLALAAVARWERSTDARTQRTQSVIIGLALGVVALVRPLDALLVGLVLGVFQLWRARQDRQRWASLAMQVVAGSLPIALLLWVNARTTGSPSLFGYEALNGPAHGLGFHVDPTGRPHTPERGLLIASGYLMRLSRYLFEWPIPGSLLVVVGLVGIKRPTRWDVLLGALAGCFIVSYGAYWFDGFFSGPRFLFTAVPAFVYFSARALMWVTDAAPRPILHRVALLLFPLCILGAWVGPNGVSSARGRVAMYREQRTKLKTDIEGQLARARLRHALVFVNDGWRGRLQARLRVLGVNQFQADRALNTLDACALQTGLDMEDTLLAQSDGERAQRVLARARAFGEARLEEALPADETIALVPGSRPTAKCIWEYQRDRDGTLAYAILLGHQHVGGDGRVGGDVIFVRDLGERNEMLRRRFGDRTWYRYRLPGSLRDTANVFLPYWSKQ